MKQFLLLVFGLVIVQLGYGQQRPQYSMYMQNNYLLNPALSGVEDYIDVRSGYRKQWLGITNAPSTFYVSAHMAINKNDRNTRRSAAAPRKTNTFKIEPQANRNSRMYKARPHHGVGVIVQSDQTGPLSTTTFNGTYAYHIPLTARIKLSSGATLGMVQHSFNPYQATVTNQNDPALMDGRTNTVNVDLGLGGWLYSDQFFVGVAAQQLIPNQNDYSNVGYTEGDGPLQRHVYITGGYKFSVSKYLDIVPSTMVKIASPFGEKVFTSFTGAVTTTVTSSV